MLHVATCLWDPNESSLPASRCFDETWVEKLYWGFRRNLMTPFRFVCFVDRPRVFQDDIGQEPLLSAQHEKPRYGCFNEPYRLNVPMILVGLDTVIVGNCDGFAQYCLTADRVALCYDPNPDRRHEPINGVQFIPVGHKRVYDEWVADGAQANDMKWLHRYPWTCINDEWPGQVSSYKCDDVRGCGLRRERICYFHGVPKMHELTHLPWIKRHWRIGY